jgi:hypothetical protein
MADPLARKPLGMQYLGEWSMERYQPQKPALYCYRSGSPPTVPQIPNL